MTILETDKQNAKTPEAIPKDRFFDANLVVPEPEGRGGIQVDAPITEPIEEACIEASQHTGQFVLSLISKRQALIDETGDDMSQEERMIKYDTEAAVRKATQEAVSVLESHLGIGLFTIGDSFVDIIYDHHAPKSRAPWLILVTDDGDWVSFKELRGLSGDDDMTRATFDHQLQLINDINQTAAVQKQP